MWLHIILFFLLCFLAASVKTGWLHIEGITDGQGWKIFLLVALLGNLLGILLTLKSGTFVYKVSDRFKREEESIQKEFAVTAESGDSAKISVQIPEKETENEEGLLMDQEEAQGSSSFRQQIMDEVIRYNQEIDDPDYYYLPKEWDGKALEWTSAADHTGTLIAALSLFAAAVALVRKTREDLEKQRKREEELLKDYPGLVMKFTLLIQAGMTVRRAFQKIALDYRRKQKKKKQAAYEEILTVCYEMESGVSEMEAYRHFGERCGQMKYKTFSTLLIQNLQKGSKRLADMLETESQEAWEERKRKARVLGEIASTKLLVPMVLMLLVVMALIMIPAFLSFYGG
ncbi:MAG: type II secretion system F family protein [Blautia sp.]|nr:type II secretion system F family protein [Blautia sp.]